MSYVLIYVKQSVAFNRILNNDLGVAVSKGKENPEYKHRRTIKNKAHKLEFVVKINVLSLIF